MNTAQGRLVKHVGVALIMACGTTFGGPVASLRSTGTQYVNTGHWPKPATRVVIKMACNDSESEAQNGFGAAGAVQSFRFGRRLDDRDPDNKVLRFFSNVNDSYRQYNYFDGPADDGIHTFDMSASGATCDGVAMTGATGTLTQNCGGPLCLFGMYQGWGGVACSKESILSCQIYHGETLVRDLVPWQKDDGTLCFKNLAYAAEDATTGTEYYLNAGTGTFEIGVKEPSINVEGSPARYGTPSPDYDSPAGVVVGEATTFTCPAVYTNDAGTIGAACAGYRYELTNGTVTVGSGLSTSIVYLAENADSTLTWLWDARFKATVVPASGVTVTQSSADGWYANGATATFTATPDAGCAISGWRIDGVLGNRSQTTLTLKMDAPHEVAAVIGRTWHVSTTGTDEGNELGDKAHPFLTVSNGLAHAELADTVVVGDGTYELSTPLHVENGIVLRSSNGAAATTLKNVDMTVTDAGEVQRVLFVNHPDAHVEGFTITDGVSLRNTQAAATEADYGLGVRIDELGGTVSSCVISNCTLGLTCRGGGAYLKGNDAVLTNCIIRQNKDSGWSCYAAGVYLARGLVTHCTIDGNTISKSDGSNKFGAGVYATGGRLSHTKVVNNRLVGGEGGAGVDIGGIVVMDSCFVASNVCTTSSGGGLRNGARWAGVLATNCTFVANSAATGAGGVYVSTESERTPVFYGCLFADNACSASSGVATFPDIVPNHASCLYCVTSQGTLSGTGCLNDPAPLSADGITPKIGSKATDICPTDFVGTSATDLLGNARRSGDRVDAGAVEYQYRDVTIEISGPTHRQCTGRFWNLEAKATVKGASTYEYAWSTDDGQTFAYSADPKRSIAFATPGNHVVTLTVRTDGTTDQTPVTYTCAVAAKDVYMAPLADRTPAYPFADWSTAATNLAQALTAAGDGTTVRSADGTYCDSVETVVDHDVTVVSTGGTAKATLKIANAHVTNEGPLARVVCLNSEGAVLDGFTVTGGSNGRPDSTCLTTEDYGAGVKIGAKGGTVRNCLVTGNASCYYNRGGGLALYSNKALVSNCVIRANTSKARTCHGGGACLIDGLIADSVFEANEGSGENSVGAALYAAGGRVTRCTFVGNKALSVCQGVITLTDEAVVDNCLVTGNTSETGVGVVRFIGKGTLLNCTVVGNGAPAAAGIGADGDWQSRAVRNCIVAGNTNLTDHGACDFGTTKGYVTYTLSPDASIAGGEGNVVGVPVFKNRRFVPRANSSAVNAGSVTGYEAYLVGGRDFLGKPRVVGKTVDMGCCESQSKGLVLSLR